MRYLPFLLLALSPLCAQDLTSDQKSVLQAEGAFRLAKVKNDTHALAALVSDQFHETNQNGNTRDKAQFLELFQSFGIQSLTLDEVHVRVAGDTAFATGTQTEDSDSMLFTRAYIKSANGWQLLSCMQFHKPVAPALRGAEADVMRVDEAYRLAKLRRDTAALEAILADAFNETNQNGNSRNKAQTLDLWKGFRIDSLTTDTSEVRLAENTAMVLGTQTENASEHMLFTRVYVKGPAGWQLLSSMQYRNPNIAP